MKKEILLLFVLIVTVVCKAQVPQTLSYQGLLTDINGSPVPPLQNGYSVIFNFYTATGTPPNLVYTKRDSRTITQIPTYQGLFTVVIGDNSGKTGSSNASLALTPPLGSVQYYIGVQIVGQNELTPYVPLTAVPYAFTASALDAGATVNGSQLNSPITNAAVTIPGSQITGTVPSSKITGLGSLAALNTVTTTEITNGTITDGDISTTGITTAGKVLGSAITGSITAASISLTGTDASKLASGTTGQRPTSAVEGQMRYNTDEKVMEYYNGTNWYFMSPKIAFLKEVFGSGVDGGNNGTFTTQGIFTPTSTVRALNTAEGDTTKVVGLQSDHSFKLYPGEYVIEASAPAYETGKHKIRIFDPVGNVPHGAGSSEFNNAGGYASTSSTCYAKITIPAGTSTKFVIQHTATSISGTTMLGLAGSFAEKEVYTQVKITKLRGQ